MKKIDLASNTLVFPEGWKRKPRKKLKYKFKNKNKEVKLIKKYKTIKFKGEGFKMANEYLDALVKLCEKINPKEYVNVIKYVGTLQNACEIAETRNAIFDLPIKTKEKLYKLASENPQVLDNLLEEKTPKKPYFLNYGGYKIGNYKCPSCDGIIRKFEDIENTYCIHCGQKLDWSEKYDYS